ncbi:MAG: preprotein translocase subunit SecY [Candidatus Paceibacterota bacterium]
MLSVFFEKLRFIATDESLRQRILFLLSGLVIFTILRAIPIPGVDAQKLSEFLQSQQFFGLLDIFSGGGLSNFSIVMLGIGPFITASIIMQLMTVMSPKVKSLYHEEGEAGKRKFIQYSRMLTVPLAMIQSFGFLTLLSREGVLSQLSSFDMITSVIVIAAGSVLLMWIGELITQYGIGNGISLLIFAGIVASLPGVVAERLFDFDISQLPLYLGFLGVAAAVIFGVVLITEAERPVPVTYAKQVRGQRTKSGVSTYLPLRLNQGGVIPIIFALSILLFPQMVFEFLRNVDNEFVASFSERAVMLFENGWVYASIYFILVFAFTYFYVAITFDPDAISKNLQKGGAFIPGIRPGEPTAEYIGNIVTRITLVGAVFLGVVAVLPLAMRAITGIEALAIGGTALLITVVVLTDLIKKIDAQITLREY